jgi:hypothetical protein
MLTGDEILAQNAFLGCQYLIIYTRIQHQSLQVNMKWVNYIKINMNYNFILKIWYTSSALIFTQTQYHP